MAKKRVVIADDFPRFLEALRSLLTDEFEIVASAGCGRSALEAIRRYQPDVAVLDLNMPCLTGIEVAEELSKDSKRPVVVICSVEADPDVIGAARRTGAGYVVKSHLETDLIPVLNGFVSLLS